MHRFESEGIDDTRYEVEHIRVRYDKHVAAGLKNRAQEQQEFTVSILRYHKNAYGCAVSAPFATPSAQPTLHIDDVT